MYCVFTAAEELLRSVRSFAKFSRSAKYFRVVRFRGVRDAHGLENIVGDHIVEEEVYYWGDGVYEFSALCDRSEFAVRFVDVEL